MTTRDDERKDPAGPAAAVPPLRQRAEERAAVTGGEDLGAPSPEQAKDLLHALRVHQIELEMQNEELRRAQQELEASRARYFDLYDLAPVSYLTISTSGLILEANLTATTLLGVARGALVKQPLSRYILPEDQDIYYLYYKRLFETGEPQVCEMRMLRADKSLLWVRLEAGLGTDPDSGAPVCRSALSDITERKRLGEQVRHQERLAAVGQLAAGVAHDFNNLMAAIGLAAQMLQQSPNLSDRERHYLGLISDRVDHSTRLIGQILDFSRRSYMDCAPLDLLPLVKQLLEALERTLPQGIRLELTSDRDEYIVHGDPARLQQALMNLAANARDAMPDRGRLQFALSGRTVEPNAPPPLPDMVTGDWVCLSVSDTGSGIAPVHLPRLFEPFFTTKEPGKGTGLGLPQVYGIVKQHGGTIAAYNRPDAGATFCIYLPLLTIPVLEAEPHPGARAAPNAAATILLVDDDPSGRLVVTEILEELGYRVLPAASAADALAILGQNLAVDLLLTVLVLPGLNGLDLYEALRQQQPALRGLIMTGYGLVGASHGVFEQAEVDWIQKPFDIDDLSTKIRAVLAGTVSPVNRARWT